MHIENDPTKPTFEIGDKVMLVQDSDTIWIVTKVRADGASSNMTSGQMHQNL